MSNQATRALRRIEIATHCVPELYSRIRLLQDRRGWG